MALKCLEDNRDEKLFTTRLDYAQTAQEMNIFDIHVVF